ncbi:MAG: hypothetical protein HC899_05855 [Leptolyngbyaceae cyanobacterium SM1_4_3]|nr:hypothetical protein [Leptolyngbyaceae cyanobacterium SM1_4_3]NJN89151.1 hypothetical protein [Leptolyngbyaceae cyanobacterium SL_5_14]
MRKPGLQRIEATLEQLQTQRVATADQAGDRAFSFKLSAATPFRRSRIATEQVRPFPTQRSSAEIPNLPKFKLPSFSSHRHVANPALAMGLLKELEGTVEGWQTELQQILLKIQALYLEGPIIDGWLESHPREAQPNPSTVESSTVIRHAEVDRLMDYVQEICNVQPEAEQTVACESPRTGYRLCGLGEDGQPWSRPCPPEQIAQVSLAIARYQKLRQLLGRKQYLEARLSQLAQTLIALHGRLHDPTLK